jgi:hypothetical protein
MYERDTRIRLALISRGLSFTMCFNAIQGSDAKARCLVNSIRSGFHPDSICCAISYDQREVRIVAQRLINDVDQDVVYYAKLTLAQ